MLKPLARFDKGCRPRGRSLALSVPRRCVIDLMHFARRVPSVPVQRRMDLARLVEARTKASPNAPSWVALFTRGYARVCEEFAELRRAFLSFPTPRLYE